MTLEIHRLAGQPSEADGLVADRWLYTNAGGTRLLEQGDPDSAFLLAAPGRVIPQADVARLGLELVDGAVRQGGSVKQAARPEDKMVSLAQAEDKSPKPSDAEVLAALDAAKALDAAAGSAPEVQTSAEPDAGDAEPVKDPPPAPSA